MKGFFALALVNLLYIAKSEMLAENVVIAINCGGQEYRDSKGVVYQKVTFK